MRVMYVFADMEWVVNDKHHIAPTQLSGIKVDSDWNIICTFFSRIRPRDGSFYMENNYAFNGAGIENFKTADGAHKVFSDFEEWIDDSDVICWWDSNSRNNFNKLFSFILKREFINKTLSLKAYVEYALTPSGFEFRGSQYSLAECRNINVPLIRHHAYNDAKAMVILLKETGFDQKMLECVPLPVPVEYYIKSEKYYVLNQITRLLHNNNCPNAGDEKNLVKVKNLRTAVKKKYETCDCCKEDFKEEQKNYRLWRISKSECEFIYYKNSNVFHTKDCRCAVCSDDICFSNNYKRLVKDGRRPCKICSPEPIKKEDNKSTLTNDQLPREQSNAIKRYNRSKKLRKQLLDSTDNENERKDILTLSHTSNAFFAGRGYNTFHLAGCQKLNGLSNICGFSKFSDAVKAGYTPCKHCKPTAKQDAVFSVPFKSREVENESVDDIKRVCENCGFIYEENKDYIRIETSVGIWNIILKRKPVTLEHINLVVEPKNRYIFHNQPMMFLSFTDAIEYIKKHDFRMIYEIEEKNGVLNNRLQVENE